MRINIIHISKYIYALYICVLSSLLPLQSVGRSNFNKGLHNLITLIQKRHVIMIEMKLLYYIYKHIYICVSVCVKGMQSNQKYGINVSL